MKRGGIIIEKNSVWITLFKGNVWLTQQENARLLGCFVAKVNPNIRAILKMKILDEREACQYHHYENGNSIELYNLEMIIALAFRIETHEAGVFRKWLIKQIIHIQEDSRFKLSVAFLSSSKIFLN